MPQFTLEADGQQAHGAHVHKGVNAIDRLRAALDALKRLAEGLAALRSGLQEIGRWDETLVVTYDEFGRSPVENEDKGTHHGLAGERRRSPAIRQITPRFDRSAICPFV